MTTLRRLVEAGARADLGTLEPKLSPLLWSSIATGKTADKHGVLNFVEPKPDGSGLQVSSSTTRKAKALWNILSQNGLATNVVGWYASHPAEPIRGSVVSNLLQEGEPAGAFELIVAQDGVDGDEDAGMKAVGVAHQALDVGHLIAGLVARAKARPADVHGVSTMVDRGDADVGIAGGRQEFEFSAGHERL
jgi:hypothetical protein